MMQLNRSERNCASLRVSRRSFRRICARRLPSPVGQTSERVLCSTDCWAEKSLARVSGEPGKTITVNFYDVDQTLYLVDLPGYGYARRSAAEKAKWSALVESYFRENQNLKLVLQLIDLKVGPTEDDDMMLDWLYQTRNTVSRSGNKERQVKQNGSGASARFSSFL